MSVTTVLTDKPKLELTESLEFVLSKRDVQLSDAVHFHFYSFLMSHECCLLVSNALFSV